MKLIEIVLNEVKIFLENDKRNYISNPKKFTRERKLTFPRLVLFLIQLPKRTLSLELSSFFSKLENPIHVTKSAFCKARQYLRPEFFIDWTSVMVNAFYKNNTDVKKFLGFRIMAVDGSTAYLMNKSKLKEHFGEQSNQSTSIPMARIMAYYDVLNKLSLFTEIFPLLNDELGVALKWVKKIESDTITIYDRGFASFALMYAHYQNDCHFLIRNSITETNVIKEFVKSGKKSNIVEIKATYDAIHRLKTLGYNLSIKTAIRVRLIRVELDTGEVEILATSLLDKDNFPTEIFKDLYFMRWGVETFFDILKNVMQMEVFTGYSKIAIEQDFYATVFTANLHSIIINDCESELQKINESRKLDYQINRNVSLGELKNEIIELFENHSVPEILQILKSKFLKNLEPIRKNRKVDRNKNTQRRSKGKFKTFLNHKRAI